MNKINLLLADDHAVVRAGLRALLEAEPDIRVVGEANDGQEAIARAEELRPDIVLLDISMPGMSGLEAAKEIKKAHSRMKILILTMHEDKAYLDECLRAGASGYVVKKAADTELVAAIRAVHRGETPIYPALADVLVDEYLAHHPLPHKQPGGHSLLTDRELEVLRLVAQGYANREIADILYLSPKTVENHRARIMQKLNLRTRADLVRYALREGLLKMEE